MEYSQLQKGESAVVNGRRLELFSQQSVDSSGHIFRASVEQDILKLIGSQEFNHIRLGTLSEGII